MEKRQYQRVSLMVEGVFYIQREEFGPREFSGIVKNISEDGIAIEVTKEKYITIAEIINIGTEIQFSFFDEYQFLMETRFRHLVGVATVNRKEKTGDSLLFGCDIRRLTKELQEYIDDKKILAYIENGFRL